MITTVAILIVLAAVAASVALASRFLRRTIPLAVLGVFLLAAILPFPRAFLSDLTPLPLDHVLYTLPWAYLGGSPPQNPYLNDVATQILPWAKAVRMAWKEGSLPLRDLWNGCGMPLASNGTSAAFSPLSFLALLFPLARALTLIASIKLLLAAAGTWLWTREIGASARAATFAGVVFALSFSFTPPWLFFPQSAVLCLLPWTLFLFDRLLDEDGRGRTIAALTAVFVFIELAGHPESAMMGFLFGALWISARATGGKVRLLRFLSALGLAAAIAVALTAFLIIPSLFAIEASGRIAAAERPYWEPLLSLAPHSPLWRSLPTALFPHTLGNGISSPMLPGGAGSFPETTLGYFGIVGWAAALMLLRPGSPRPRVEWVLLVILLCGWGISNGLWPLAEIFSRTPVVRLLFPPRFNSWEALAGSALAALELDRLARDAASRRRAAILASLAPIALGILAVALFFAFRAEHTADGGLPFQSRQLWITLITLSLVALIFLAARHHPGLSIAALTLLAGAELLYEWRGLFRLYSPALLFPDTPMIAFLHRQPGTFRVVGQGPVLFPSTNVFSRLEDIRTHDAVERRDYLAFLDATCGYRYEYFKILRNVDAPALDFLNVRYVLTAPGGTRPGERWHPVYSGPDGIVFENGRVLPRAFSPASVRLVRAPSGLREPLRDANAAFGDAFREIAANTDWRGTAWVLADRNGAAPNGPAEIFDYRESVNTAAFAARVVRGPAWVVLSLVQDGGWTARNQTGAGVALRRANGPFLAMELPAGKHRIFLRYVPPGFRAGAAVSLATVLSLAMLAAVRSAPRRRFSLR